MTERFLEAVGPIVVKEVRQGLRARVFAICFGLLLLACLVAALVAAAEVREWQVQSLGPRYLTLFLCGLALVCFFVIPYTAYRSMAREREDETWVLLALTGLSSRRIVRGKVASALTQALLYSSAGAPFMVFSYFLNGVDLPTLLLEVFFAGCWAVFVTSVAVALGTEGHSRLGRAATHFLVLGLLGAATVGGMVFGAEMAKEGSQWLSDEGFLAFALAFPAALLTTSALVLEGAAAGLALASDATVKGARLVVCGQWVVGVAATYLGASLVNGPPRELPAIASVFSSLFLGGFGFFAIAERDGRPRSQKSVTWLTSGALRGWRLVMGLLVLSTGAWWGLYLLLRVGHGGRDLYTLFAAPLYVGFYLSLAVLVGRLTPLWKLGQPVATRLSFLGLVTCVGVLSPVAAVISGLKPNDRALNALNPVVGMANFIDRLHAGQAEPILVLLLACWLLSASLAWVVLRRLDRERIG